MNKRDVIKDLSEKTEIDTTTCTRVIASLETVLSNELEKSGGIRSAFDKIHALLDMIRGEDDQQIFKEDELFDKLANNSDASKEQCLKIVNALIDILNNKVEISKSAKMKFDIAYKLANFFKH